MDYVRSITSNPDGTYTVHILNILRDKTKTKIKADYEKAIQQNKVRAIEGVIVDEDGRVILPELISDERIKWEIIDKVIKNHNGS